MAATPEIFVTAASGQLGGGVVETLLETVPATAIVAGVRQEAEAAAGLRGRGVETRVADYSRPETLASAFRGVERLLLVSGSELGQRVGQHRNVIDAAKAAGVGMIAYTSILHADTTPLFLAEEHRATESVLAESGVPHVLLRNGWYTEVYTWRLPGALDHGVLLGAAAAGRISSAARADYARAAAAVLVGEGHAGQVYELAGDASFTLAELAAVVADATGQPMEYRDMAPDELRSALAKAGLPDMLIRILPDTDAGVAKGALFNESGTLARLIGRPTTPFRETITGYLRTQASTTQTPRPA